MIQKIYNQAIEPARVGLERARDAERVAAATAVTMPKEHRTLSAITMQKASHDMGYASAQLNNTIQEVGPVYQEAIRRLNQDYQAVIQPLSNRFQQLPL